MPLCRLAQLTKCGVWDVEGIDASPAPSPTAEEPAPVAAVQSAPEPADVPVPGKATVQSGAWAVGASPLLVLAAGAAALLAAL